MEYILLVCSIVAILIIVQMVKVVPQQQAWVVEKFGKFDRVSSARIEYFNSSDSESIL